MGQKEKSFSFEHTKGGISKADLNRPIGQRKKLAAAAAKLIASSGHDRKRRRKQILFRFLCCRRKKKKQFREKEEWNESLICASLLLFISDHLLLPVKKEKNLREKAWEKNGWIFAVSAPSPLLGGHLAFLHVCASFQRAQTRAFFRSRRAKDSFCAGFFISWSTEFIAPFWGKEKWHP